MPWITKWEWKLVNQRLRDLERKCWELDALIEHLGLEIEPVPGPPARFVAKKKAAKASTMKPTRKK